MANAKRDPRLNGAPVAAPAADLSAMIAEAVAKALAGVTQAPAAKPAKAAKAVSAKPKAAINGHDLFKQLSTMTDGVEIGATGTGRAKITAFCRDGYIITVMSDK